MNKNERGSYTIEACVSLVFFLLIIYFIFSQVSTLVMESTLQRAVNGMAKEISGFSYYLDRAGLIIEHDDDEMKSTTEIMSSATKTTELISGLYNDMNSDIQSGNINTSSVVKMAGQAKSIGESMSFFLDVVSRNIGNLKEDVKNAGKYAVETAVEKIASNALANYYCDWKLDDYLPTDRESFCRINKVVDGFDFSHSQFMPSTQNNSVYIEVSCEVKSVLAIPGFEKKRIVKCSYAPLWVRSNTK